MLRKVSTSFLSCARVSFVESAAVLRSAASFLQELVPVIAAEPVFASFMLLGAPVTLPVLETVSLPPRVTFAVFANLIVPASVSLLPFAVVRVPLTASVAPDLTDSVPFTVSAPFEPMVSFAPFFTVRVVPLGSVTLPETVTFFLITYF